MNTLIGGGAGQVLLLLSGQFTSTVKDSEDVTSVNANLTDISYDGTNTYWCGFVTADKLYQQSGLFTSTVKDSENIGGIDTVPSGISSDVTNIPWLGEQARKLYLQSGKFTSTVKDSEALIGIDIAPKGVSWDGTNTPWIGANDDKFYLQSGQFTSTIKTSASVPAGAPEDISFDGTDTLSVDSITDRVYKNSAQFTTTVKTSLYISGIDASPVGVDVDDFDSRLDIQPIFDTPWSGTQADKLYLQSGQFLSTVKTSEYVGGVDTGPNGISWDGTDTPWCGNTGDKLYLQSGQFTSTLKDSEYIGGIEDNPQGITWDGTNSPWVGNEVDKLYLQSGQFTSTVKTSEYVGDIDTFPSGISYDGTNTPWSGNTDDKLYLQSDQFTSTVKTSEYVGDIDISPTGISYDGTNTLWSGSTDNKLYLQSGQFTSTIKTSRDINSIDTIVTDIDTNNLDGRLGIAPGIYNRSVSNTITFGHSVVGITVYSQSSDNTISFGQTVSQSGSIFNRSLENTISFGQDLSVIYDRSLENTISFGHSIADIAIYSRSLANTISFGQTVSQSGSTFNRSLENTISFGQDRSAIFSTYATPWVGSTADKLYLQSGHFTSTLKTSEYVGGIDLIPIDISWDDRNTPWVGNDDDKLYLQSGQFTSTLKTSEDVSGVTIYPYGISWDGENTPWCGYGGKLYLTSDQFTSTIKNSQAVSDNDNPAQGITWDSTNTPWVSGGAGNDGTLYLTSGQFTSTIKDSEFIESVDTNPQGITWDGTNTPWVGAELDKLYLQSGQFTSTIKTSRSVTSIDTNPRGLCTNNLAGRLNFELYYRPVSDPLTITDTVSRAGSTFNRSPENTITFGQIVTQSGSIFNRSRSNTITFGQSVSQSGSIFNRSRSNTISFSQSVSQSGSIFNRSLSNTLSFGYSVISSPSIYSRSLFNTITFGHDHTDVHVHVRSFSSTISLTQDVDSERIGPTGVVYNLDFENSISFDHSSNYILITLSGETYYGQAISTISGLSQDFVINGVYNRSLSNTITFSQSLPKEDPDSYLLDIPRWVKASTSEYFNQVAQANSLQFHLEGTHRDTDGQQKFIEFRLDGPDSAQMSKNYYSFDIEINILWSFKQDDDNFYEVEDIKGMLIDAMQSICVYKYGDSTQDDSSFIGTLQLKDGEVRVNNFGQVRPDVRLMQGSVEGTYRLVVYLPDLDESPIVPIDLTVDSKIREYPHWIIASANKHFSEIATANNIHFCLEGTHRFTSGRQKFIEFRVDGPNVTEVSKDYYRFDVKINILWSFKPDDVDFHEPERIQGILLRAMQDICVYRYGDDGAFVGTLQLRQDKKTPVRISNFGQIRPDVRLMQGTVEGDYTMLHSVS